MGHGQAIEDNLTKEHLGKTMEAVSAIRGMVKEKKSPKKIAKVLKEIQKIPTRDAVRTKFRQQRDKPGHASVQFNGTDAFIVVHFADKGSIGPAVRLLGQQVEWDLVVAEIRRKKGSVEIVIT